MKTLLLAMGTPNFKGYKRLICQDLANYTIGRGRQRSTGFPLELGRYGSTVRSQPRADQ